MLALMPVILWGSAVSAFEMQPVKVTANIYALVGSNGARTYENHALNTTAGFVITNAGIVVIDSGASARGAALIEAAIRKITDKPLRWLINTGVQDHKWLGNGYFAAKGVKIIALARTVAGQHKNADAQMLRLKAILKDRQRGTEPFYAPEPIRADKATLKLGGEVFEIIWPGPAHFPGDVIIYLPGQRVVFSGDLVFIDRMLGVLPMSNTKSWQQAFNFMAALKPVHIIPGHGRPGGMAEARRDTGDYLDWLIGNIAPAAKNWVPLEETVAKLSDAPFKFLRHYDAWHKTNLNRTYLQLEAQ